MTFSEFREETSNLEMFFEKQLNAVQAQVWYEELKDYPLVRYQKAIRKVCKTSQYKPTLSAMLDAIKSVGTEAQERQSVPCKACNGTGYVLYKQVFDGKEYEYASICNCQNAVGLEYDGRKCRDEKYRTEYYTPKAVDIFHVETF